MDEKLVQEMVLTLKSIQEKLFGVSYGHRGPVADPAPDWHRGPVADPAPDWWDFRPPRWGHIQTIMGPVADPGPELMLDKPRLAQLKVRRLDQAIAGLQSQIEFHELERKLLMEEHGLEG